VKVKAKDYAKALVDVKKFDARRFLRILQRNGDTKKLKEIVVLAEKMMLAKSGNQKIVLEIARPVTKKMNVGKKGDMVEEKINPTLIAGVKIIIDGEKQLDFSLSKKLNDIFK
jgi:F0F1-type ATP synthase delta subunit